jgi:hypothetical protein
MVGKEPVGAVVCALDDKKKSLCVATLAVLAPYRRGGIGTLDVPPSAPLALSLAPAPHAPNSLCVHVKGES